MLKTLKLNDVCTLFDNSLHSTSRKENKSLSLLPGFFVEYREAHPTNELFFNWKCNLLSLYKRVLFVINKPE